MQTTVKNKWSYNYYMENMCDFLSWKLATLTFFELTKSNTYAVIFE